MNLKDRVKAQATKELVEQNPFVTSESFLSLVQSMAVLSRTILLATRGPGEGLNAIASLITTFLKNIPDSIWEALRKTAQGQPCQEIFAALEKVRSFQPEKAIEVTLEQEDEDMPPLTVNPPNMPC